MARVKMEPGTGIAGLSGRIGNLVFRMSADGATYAQQAPTAPKGPGSAAQQQYRKRFAAAAAYGRAQQASAEGRAYYQPLVRPGRFASIYSMALSDYLEQPRIQLVEASGCCGPDRAPLRIQAHDPCGVFAVWVRIVDATGQIVEEGSAALETTDWWAYQTTQPQPTARQVQITAQDRPGNTVELVVDLPEC